MSNKEIASQGVTEVTSPLVTAPIAEKPPMRAQVLSRLKAAAEFVGCMAVATAETLLVGDHDI